MFKDIKNDFCALKIKVGTEQAFKLSPVYLLSGQPDLKYIEYLLEKIRKDLEEEGGMLRSSAFVPLSLSYNLGTAELGLLNEFGEFRNSLDRWLSFIINRYHAECGIVLINISSVEELLHADIYFQKFLNDIRKHKNHFLFFICSNEMKKLESHISSEVFTVYYDVGLSKIDDFVNWVITEARKNKISVSDENMDMLKVLFTKYEGVITFHIIDMWIKTIMWNYLSLEKEDGDFWSPKQFEALLVQAIEKNSRTEKKTIGFC